MTPSMSRPCRRLGSTGKPSASSRSSAPLGRTAARPSAPVLDQDVEPRRQPAAGGHRGVDLPQRAGAAVARVGVQRQSGLLALGVDARELGLGHEHLAADLERGGLGESLRDGLDGPQVGGHVLAGRAVAAGRALDEAPSLVAQGDGQAVDLELGDVRQLWGRLRRRAARGPSHAGVEGAQLVVR